nr:nucleolar protein 9-like [Physcomitrium patens]|eukprot:XP_024396053.1 nucleolar protein 9-like [Physcomitrella patens]
MAKTDNIVAAGFCLWCFGGRQNQVLVWCFFHYFWATDLYLDLGVLLLATASVRGSAIDWVLECPLIGWNCGWSQGVAALTLLMALELRWSVALRWTALGGLLGEREKKDKRWKEREKAKKEKTWEEERKKKDKRRRERENGQRERRQEGEKALEGKRDKKGKRRKEREKGRRERGGRQGRERERRQIEREREERREGKER